MTGMCSEECVLCDFVMCGHHRVHLYKSRWYSLLTTHLGCKLVQRSTILNSVGSCNTMLSICISKHRKGTIKTCIKDQNDAPE